MQKTANFSFQTVHTKNGMIRHLSCVRDKQFTQNLRVRYHKKKCHSLENNIKMDTEVTGCEVGYIWCRRGPAVGPPKYSNEPPGVIKGREILDEFLKNYILHTKVRMEDN